MRLKEYKSISFVYAFVLIFILWQVIGVILNKSIFPTPVKIIVNMGKTFQSQIAIHAIYSLRRIVFGILLTLLLGIPLGILMGYFRKVDSILSPILYFNYPIPKIALLPIVMLIFGLGELTKVIMIFMITFFPIVINIRDEVKNIPEEVLYPMYSLGAGTYRIINEIILPATIPAILTSLRLGIGTAISVLFFTENFGTEYGMGYFIMDSWMRINYIQMYSGILTLSVIGLIFFITIDILEVHICSWDK
ncbi:ABC transporter permease [Wukongibacter baidiensis]|uniref:ABC transporter permease n=1 Tax=Wukongibacter baidiensis TaxID=1723361 RepID=UPI003D7F2EB5